jgi:nucleoside-diphosphate-sugar epimerase
MTNMAKTILVTGAGGYVGIPLCNELMRRGYSVIAVDRYYFGMNKLGALIDDPQVKIVTDDIRRLTIENFAGVYGVVDLAGLSNDASSDIDPRLTEEINKKAGARLPELAKAAGVRRYVYASSASVYGHGLKNQLVETDECRPQTAYASSKLFVEQELSKLTDDNFETVIFRNATIFGLAPRMRFDLAINIMTLRAWRERVIYIMGGGNQWRPFVHVNDVVQSIVLGLEADASIVSGEIFNIGHEEQNYQIKQLAQFIMDVIPNVKLHVIPDDPDKRTYNLSFDKVREKLGFEPSTRVHEGVVEIKQALDNGLVSGDDPTCYTLQWYKELIDWEQRIRNLTLDGNLI